MIRRILASLLLIAHLGAVAAPAIAFASVERTGQMCAFVGGHAEAGSLGSVTAPTDCNACDMLACPYMFACAAISPAVTPAAAQVLIPPLVVSSVVETHGCEATFLTTPIPPPPRA